MKLVKSVKLVIALVTFIGLFFGVTFAQEGQLTLQACGDAQVVSQSSDQGKVEVEFTSASSIAKCFNDLNSQLNDAGWERVKGDNNIYKSDFYRIVYTQNGVNAMLLVRQTDNLYKVILDL